MGKDALETSKRKNQQSHPISQLSTKHLVSLIKNKSVEIKSNANDRNEETFGVVFVDGENVKFKMVKAGLAEVYRGRSPSGFDNYKYRKPEHEAREISQGRLSFSDRFIIRRECRKHQME